MAGKLAWGFDEVSAGPFGINGDRTRPKQPQRPACRCNDRGFQASLGWARVDHQGDASAEALQHMLRARGTDRAAAVGGWRGERTVGGAQERLHGWMRRHSNADRR